MKAIRFLTDFFAVDGSGNSNIKYCAGASYPPEEETSRLAASGIAEEIDVPEEPATLDQQLAPDHPADSVPAP